MPRLFAALLLLALIAPLRAQATESSIITELKGLRAVPDPDRPAATRKIAEEISSLPAGDKKVRLAEALSDFVTEGDPGQQTLQAVATTLGQSLAESPSPAADGEPPMPYMNLARLVRYEHVTTTLDSPLLKKATDLLIVNDADIQHADFTLTDLDGKKYTLSQLHGKIVVVNFWATWCPPCRKEMPDLDALYTRYKSQGLIVLSISDEEMSKVAPFIAKASYHPPVLLDPNGAVAKEFHVDGIPKSFVFDRTGKLAAQSIDMRTQRQFLAMLAEAGLKP